MTFRKLFTSDDIHNYFWKARLIRGAIDGFTRHPRPRCDHQRRLHEVRRALGPQRRRPHRPSRQLDGRRSASTKQDIDAYWLGTAQRSCGITLAKPLELIGKPVSRVENFCATGSEALRQASYAVASGAYDIAMAVGVEKVKDAGYQGVPATQPPNDGTARTLTAAAMYSMIAPAYTKKYGVSEGEMRDALSHIASKNHFNGARNPRAQFRREVSKEQIEQAPKMAGTLGVFDCAGVADGGAAAIVVRAEDAAKYTDKPLYIKALSFVAGNGSGLSDPNYDYTTFPEVVDSAEDAYRQAGHHRPALATGDGRGARLLHADRDGVDGRSRLRDRARRGRRSSPARSTSTVSCRSTPTADSRASAIPSARRGLRMMFECWLQLRGEAPDERRLGNDRKLALTHNLGGYPGEMVSFVSILGTELADVEGRRRRERGRGAVRQATRRHPHPRRRADAGAAVCHAVAGPPGRRRRQGRAAVRGVGSRRPAVDARPRRACRRRDVPAQQPQQAQPRHRPEVRTRPRSLPAISCRDSTSSPRTSKRARWTASGSGTTRSPPAVPAVIYLSISGFGASGSPYSSWPAYAPIVEAMSGIYEYLNPTGRATAGRARRRTR